MTLQEAKEKAQTPMQASNGDPKAYEIPFEKAESIKSLVGKKITYNGQTVEIIDWVGQNFVIYNDKIGYNINPAMRVLQMCNNKNVTIQ